MAVLVADDEIPDEVLFEEDVLLIVEFPSPLLLLVIPLVPEAGVALMLPVRFILDILVADPERVATAAEDLLDMLEDDVRTLVAAALLPILLVRENPGLLRRPTVEAREP